MTTNEITYGIEIECCIPLNTFNASGMCVGGRHNGRQITWMPIGWNAQNDCSIHAPVDHVAVEIVSPILKGEDGLAQIRQVLAKLNDMGAKVNASTGLHVHVGVSRDPVLLRNLIRLVAQHEKAIYATTGTHAREQNRFCAPIKSRYFGLKDLKSIEDLDSIEGEIVSFGRGRYQLLNLMNLVTHARDTVEFRAFAGTLNVVKLIGYVQVCVGLVAKAASFKCAPCYASANKTRSDEPTNGVDAVAKLLRILNWTRNGGYGVIDLSTVKGIKAEFNRLATKYDASAV